MDNSKLIKAREYYDRVEGGEDKKSAALAVIGKKTFNKIEEWPEYKTLVAIGSQLEREKLKTEIEQLKRKKIKSYSNLLDKGEELMNEAETTKDKIIAQNNQRANLSVGVVEDAIAWDSADRNQNDMGEVLEGVII